MLHGCQPAMNLIGMRKSSTFHVFIILAYPGEEGWMLAFAPEHGQLLKAKEAKAPTAKVAKTIHHIYMLEKLRDIRESNMNQPSNETYDITGDSSSRLVGVV